MKTLLSAVGAILLATTLPATAQLAPISDTLVIRFGGTVISLFLREPDPGLETLSINNAPTGDPAKFGSYTVLTEPDGTISDVFGVIPTFGVNDSAFGITGSIVEAFNFAFISDPEGGLGGVPNAFINPLGGTPIILAEGNGGPFDVTAYLSPDLRAQGFTGTFQSDVEPVPEPATLALLGLGLAGLGFSRRKR